MVVNDPNGFGATVSSTSGFRTTGSTPVNTPEYGELIVDPAI